MSISSLEKSAFELGVTLTSLDETITRLTEPQSSSPSERLTLAPEGQAERIKTFAFLGPLLPDLSDREEDILQLLRVVKEAGVDFVYADRLNPRYGVWPALQALLGEHFPHLTGGIAASSSMIGRGGTTRGSFGLPSAG